MQHGLGFIKIFFIILAVAIVSGLVFFIRSGRSPSTLFSQAMCPNCNVIVVTLDTLGADHMALYGYNRTTSPFLDSFALKRSVVFDHAIAQGSWTPLSHTSILTGRYPAEYGIFGSTDKLPPGTETLAVAMKARGYVTHAVSAAILIQPQYGWGQGFDSFEERWFIDSVKNNDAQTTFSLAADWIKKNKQKPFFLFINTNHLHSPHTPATEKVLEELGVPPPYNIGDERDVVGPNVTTGNQTQEDLTLMANNYDGLIRELDQVLENFIKQLDQEGLTQNTIILFEGDHSQQFGEHNILGWYGVYDTQIHVPFILYIPGQKPHRISPVVELRSIPSTILDLIGSKPDQSFTGKSLLPLLEGKQLKTIALTMNAQSIPNNLAMLQALFGKSPSVWEAMRDAPPPTVRKNGDVPKSLWHSARSEDWQLIKNDDGSLELYDLRKDPKETQNLIDKWYQLSVSERKGALEVFKALGSDIPASCGPYCPR